MKLLVEAGDFASTYHGGLKTERGEADEIWAFVGAKQRRAVRPGDGDIWTFTALDADSKLMITWFVGPRSQENAISFMQDLRSRLTRRMHYCRPHQTLTKAPSGTKTTPAMAAGLTDRVWTVKDVLALMDPAAARVE